MKSFSRKFIKSVGEEFQVVKMDTGQGYHNHLPFNIKAVRKNIKWGRGEGDIILCKKMKI